MSSASASDSDFCYDSGDNLSDSSEEYIHRSTYHSWSEPFLLFDRILLLNDNEHMGLGSSADLSFSCSVYFYRGANETSTSEITAAIIEQSKRIISQKLSVAKDNIAVDCDAISVIISTPARTMSNEKKEAIKDFLHVFGSDMSGCSLPHHSAMGSSKASGLFGCGGNLCQHLPECLQGQEMLVLDTPVKVGLHKSCKEKMNLELNSKGYYLSPSNSNNVCFDAQAAFNIPPYGIMIEAIINSSCTDGNHVIHVADIGSRYPVTLAPNSNSQISKLFQTIQAMITKGITVELAQCDIAFVCSVPKGQLVQVSLDRKQQQKTCLSTETDWDCRFPLFDGLLSTVFPIHSLPDFEGQKLSQRDLKGTVLLRRADPRWRAGGEVVIASQDDDDFTFSDSDAFSEATDLFASSNANGSKVLATSSSNLFSLKVYSTIAHSLLQKRQTYPLSPKSMYGMGNRSITTIQTLLKNLDKARMEAFDKVRTHGIGVRIEVSIRPHPDDNLRKVGHFNDILLLVALAILGLCQGRRFVVKLSFIAMRPIETKAMELVTQCMAMLKFRHQSQFNEVYTNEKVVEWLRSHLSILLITIGVSPQYGVKYINVWLNDYRRYDPYNKAGRNPTTQFCPVEDTATRRKGKLLKRLKPFLRGTLKMKEGDVETLIQFINVYPDPSNRANAKECYKKLSFQAKLLLPTLLFSEIIPFISAFMSGEKEKAPKSDNDNKGGPRAGGCKRNRDTVVIDMVETTTEMEEEEDKWFLQQEYLHQSMSLKDIAEIPMPSDPLSLAINAMFQISSFSDPGRPGFTAMLFGFIFHSYRAQLVPNQSHHNHNIEKVTMLAARIAYGNILISPSVLRLFCASIGLCGHSSNRSRNEYLRQLCYYFQFPCQGVRLRSKTKHGRHQNKILNEVIEQDLVTVVHETREFSRLYRNADDSVIDIFRPEKVALMERRPEEVTVRLSQKNLYCVLAACLNTTENGLRESLHRRMSSLQKLRGLFLGSNGVTDKEFRGSNNLEELQNLKAFQIRFTGKISDFVRSQSFPPNVILPLVCLVYTKDIIFYDFISNRTSIYTSCNLRPSRVIKYVFKGLKVSSKLMNSISISLGKSGEYEWNEVTTLSTSDPQQSNFFNHHFFSLDPFGGRTSTGRNAKQILPNQTVKRNQSFYNAMSTLLLGLDPNYIDQICEEDGESDEGSNNRDMSTLSGNDALGIISFMEQLYSCARPFTGFGRGVKENCRTFNLALPSLLAFLKNVHLNDLNHNVLCPIISLQHKLSFGVLEIATNRKRLTHFYSFDPFKEQVEYKQFKEYTVLIDHHEVLYLFSSSSQTGYYMPSTLRHRHWNHDNTIKTNFSYLSNDNYDRVFQKLQSKYDLDLVSQHEMQPANFRPETDHSTVILPTHIKCESFGLSLLQMMQRGIKHHALIIIFPCKDSVIESYTGRGEWDTCVVHHPLQEMHDAMATLQSFLCNAPTEGSYNTECIQGRCPENCEANLYMMLYAYLAHKVRSLANFKVAMRKLHTEDDLNRKVRMWVHQLANEIEGEGGVPLPPVWIEQLTDSRETADT